MSQNKVTLHALSSFSYLRNKIQTILGLSYKVYKLFLYLYIYTNQTPHILQKKQNTGIPTIK